MNDGRPTTSSTDALDCLADALDDAALEAEAAAAGEDIAGAAAILRAHFLERVAAARGGAGPLPSAATSGDIKDGASPAADGEHHEGDEAPPTIGRYPILRRLGAGGMGVVYAAYDEVLDRKVAIKVLRSSVVDVDGRRRDRLLREAQAMARVTHPNVVTVHDVGTAGEQIFVAMEFVAGATVHEWLAAEERPWEAIVAVFRQAADGLAALHDAGLVHRDVKPSNMILGEDGRLRVLDLGLVGTEPREMDDTLESGGVSSSVNRLDVPLTITGERVGTPAYMSREQFLGLPLTPSSDIFALSIALYEALHGVHPFMAASYAQLQGNVLYGRVREPEEPSAIPGWLHALVVSGLAIDPADRPPTMRAYSAALAGPRRKHGRWIGTLGIAALATFGGVTIAWSQSGPGELPCDGGQELMRTSWSPKRAAAIEQAMVATGRPYAEDLADRVRETVDAYTTRWADAHRRACREYARGDHSAALYDARIACLDRRRHALEETLRILADADAEVVENAGQMVAKLPPLAACDDLTALAQRRAPADPQLASAVQKLEGRLVRAEAQANAGRTDEAIAIARAVAAEAQHLDHAPTVALALLSEARASINRPVPRREVGDVLARALTLALAEDLEAYAAEAMIRRLYVRALRPGRSELALEDLPLAEAMLANAGDPPELRALFLNNSGAIRLSVGDREGAREAFEAALAARERVTGADHLDNAATLANLGMLTADPTLREGLHARMIAIYEAHLGPEHPQTLDGRLVAALYTDDPAAAAGSLRALCRSFRELDDLGLASECAYELGRIEDARGDAAEARAAFEAARAATADDTRRVLLDAYLALDAGADARADAIAGLRALLTTVDAESASDVIDWWIRVEQAERRLLLARLLLLAADDAPAGEAAALLERALEDVEALAGEAPPIERERLLASCRAALVVALRGDADHNHSSEVEARVAALAAAARAYYERWPGAYRRRLATLRPVSPRR